MDFKEFAKARINALTQADSERVRHSAVPGVENEEAIRELCVREEGEVSRRANLR